EAGQRKLQGWAAQHKLKDLVELKLDGRTLVLERHQAAIEKSLELAGCYVVTTDVLKPNMSAQEVHDSYVSLQEVERDFRAMKTGLLEVRPLFLRKESRTRGHVFCCMLALKLSREMERRLQKQFGTTDSTIALTKVDPHLCSDNWPTNRFTANVLSAVCLCFSPSWGAGSVVMAT